MSPDTEIEQMRLIYQAVADHYYSSRDFNGIEFNALREQIGCSVEELATDLATLVTFGLLTVTATSYVSNPFIKSFDDWPVGDQINALDTGGRGIIICVYPTERALAQTVEEHELRDKPFTRRHYKGEPQLRFYTFELNVLASYQDDPRYVLDFDGINGRIYLLDEFHINPDVHERDKVFLQTFGFAYDSTGKRAIAVYLRYLSRLSSEHQQIWNAKLITGKYEIHPDYYRQSIQAQWAERIPVYRAFVGELQTINGLCELMGKPRLFKFDYPEGERIKGLEPLYRSTSKAYYEFVHLVDKLLSESINRDFFIGDVQLENEISRRDGKVQVEQKGTIRLLEEWIKKYFSSIESQIVDDAFTKIRKIRKARQRPAHTIMSDIYDPAFFDQQQELMRDAYEFVHALRLIFSSHPNASGYDVPDWLEEEIQTF
jgi:hypothetical protein